MTDHIAQFDTYPAFRPDEYRTSDQLEGIKQKWWELAVEYNGTLDHLLAIALDGSLWTNHKANVMTIETAQFTIRYTILGVMKVLTVKDTVNTFMLVKTGDDEGNVFVPGPWLEGLQVLFERHQANEEFREASVEAKKVAELRKQLGFEQEKEKAHA